MHTTVLKSVITNCNHFAPQTLDGAHLMISIFTRNPENFIGRKFV